MRPLGDLSWTISLLHSCFVLLVAISLGVSLVTDLRSRLILDVVTYPTLGLSLVVRARSWDGRALRPRRGLLGAAVGLGVFLLPRGGGAGHGRREARRRRRGGEIGFDRIFGVLFWIAIAGGIFAFVVMLKAAASGAP